MRIAILLVIFLLTDPLSYGYGQESRTWFSRDGQNSVDAVFVGYDSKAKQVALQTNSGETIQVDFHKLSGSDQRHVIHVARKGLADDDRPEDSKNDAATANKKNTRPGKQTQSRRNLWGINWIVGLENALQVATGKETPDDDRPLMWLRVLGQLDGFM